MRLYKKIAVFALCALLLMSSGCVYLPNGADTPTEQGFDIICGSYPIYDWAVNITDGVKGVNVSLLTKDGVDIHSYQPSAEDIIRLHKCDMLILNGGESDKAVLDATAKIEEEGVSVMLLMQQLGSLLKEDSSVSQEGGGHEAKEDEHIWLSLKNAVVLCNSICDRISELDPRNKEFYRQNTDGYIKKLDELDREYQKAAQGALKQALIFADRFPFLYLANDYALNCYAAFPGCSAETEASFNTVLFLAQKAEEYDTDILLTVDGGSGAVAEAVAANMTKEAKVKTLNSMQSVTAEQREAGLTYLSAMEDNLEILKAALMTEG